MHCHYGKSHVLFGVDLEVNNNEVVGLLGRNGVGKSTLLKAVMGIVPPTVREGRILFQDEEVTHKQPNEIALRGLAYVPEERRIFPQLTVLENLSLGLDIRGKGPGEKTEALEEIYQHFPVLASRRRQLGESLSGGEQQMLAIARAMLMAPELILMDEPTEGLMPLLVKEIGNLIPLLKNKGISILVVEQSAVTGLQVSDRIYVMEKGVIRFNGTPQEFRMDEVMVKDLLGV